MTSIYKKDNRSVVCGRQNDVHLGIFRDILRYRSYLSDGGMDHSGSRCRQEKELYLKGSRHGHGSGQKYSGL